MWKFKISTLHCKFYIWPRLASKLQSWPKALELTQMLFLKLCCLSFEIFFPPYVHEVYWQIHQRVNIYSVDAASLWLLDISLWARSLMAIHSCLISDQSWSQLVGFCLKSVSLPNLLAMTVGVMSQNQILCSHLKLRINMNAEKSHSQQIHLKTAL